MTDLQFASATFIMYVECPAFGRDCGKFLFDLISHPRQDYQRCNSYARTNFFFLCQLVLDQKSILACDCLKFELELGKMDEIFIGTVNC
jgi:hypothetical protein